MSDAVVPAEDDSLPLSMVCHVNAVCNRFEAEWRAGRRPRIEDFVSETPEAERPALLRELILLDIFYRRDDGPTRAEDYQVRFASFDPAWLAGGQEGLTVPADQLPGGTVSPPHLPATGRCFGGYELHEEIGRGGMGVVYKARQLNLDRLVALKMIRTGPEAGADELTRFQREAEAAARLQHPNVVQIHEVGEHDGRRFLALEYVAGGSLASRLVGGPLPAAEATRLVEALARAVQHAHERGVVHRDLKPGNILLTVDGTPKVADFGLAKRWEVTASQTLSGTVVGTPAYMAPEQAEGRPGTVGPACDVYALGAILYECLTGRPPFQGATVLDTLEQVRTLEPVPVRHLQPKVSRDLETICLKCLRKEPAGRYASALAVADDLRRFRDGEPIHARPVLVWERAVKWARRRPAVAALAAACGLSLLLLGTILIGSYVQIQLDNANLTEANARIAAEEQQKSAALAGKTLALEQVERTTYRLSIALAHREWLANDPGRAERLLLGCPAPLRHWEWRYLWRLCHSEERTIRGHRGWVCALAYSPDGRRLASGGGKMDATVKLWDANTGQELLTLQGHTGGVISVAFSPDGTQLASADWDGAVKLWDANSGRELRTWRDPADSVFAVAFHPDGRWLAVALGASWYDAKPKHRAGRAKLLDVATGEERHTLRGHTERVTSVAFRPDGRRLATASDDRTVKLWDVVAGREIRSLSHDSRLIGFTSRVAYSPDGKHVATARNDGFVCVWEEETGREVRAFSGNYQAEVAYSPDGRFLAWLGGDKTVLVWDGGSGREPYPLVGHTEPVQSVAFSPDNRRLASDGSDGLIKVWDRTTWQECRKLGGGSAVSALAYSSDGTRLLSASLDLPAQVKVWDAASGRRLDVLRGAGGLISALACSPDGRHVAAACNVFGQPDQPGEVLLWDAATGRPGRVLRGHRGQVLSLAYDRDGRRLATAGWDHTVKVWDADTGAELLTLTGHHLHVNCVAFSPDGGRLASGSGDRTVKVWDAVTGQELCTHRGHNSSVNCVAFLPNGQQLASGGWDTIRICDAATGQESTVLRGHTADVRSLAFCPDGLRLISGSQDGTVRVWDVAGGEELLVLRGNTGTVNSVALRGDGRQMASADANGYIRLWEAP